jgi:hypothetical protein
VAEYLHQRRLPGFLLSLDFFHAFDKVSLAWIVFWRPWALAPSSGCA